MKESQTNDQNVTTTQPEKVLLTVGDIVVTISEGIIVVIENGIQTYTNRKLGDSSNPGQAPPKPPGGH